MNAVAGREGRLKALGQGPFDNRLRRAASLTQRKTQCIAYYVPVVAQNDGGSCGGAERAIRGPKWKLGAWRLRLASLPGLPGSLARPRQPRPYRGYQE